MASNVTAVDGVCPPELAMTRVFGAVKDIVNDYGEEIRHVFLRPAGLLQLCNEYGFDRSGLLIRLRDTGIFEPVPRSRVDDRGEIVKDAEGNPIIDEVDYKSMRIRNTGGNAYHFKLRIDFADWKQEISDAPEISAPEKIF